LIRVSVRKISGSRTVSTAWPTNRISTYAMRTVTAPAARPPAAMLSTRPTSAANATAVAAGIRLASVVSASSEMNRVGPAERSPRNRARRIRTARIPEISTARNPLSIVDREGKSRRQRRSPAGA
jgi:hypothetical protein